jgi:hypothetical protein
LITNTGKNIIAKYLIGQAPSYASHIALGVGPRPLADEDPLGDYSAKQNLDFEVLRIPITSRGYFYDENGESNIVFSAEVPSDQRYEFTEVGVFSGKSNPAAGNLDSKIVYAFSEAENWEYHTENVSSSIPTLTGLLDNGAGRSLIAPEDGNGNPIYVFRVNSSNDLFNSEARKGRYERPRFLDKSLIIHGDMSHIVADINGRLSVKPEDEDGYYGSHIHLAGIRANFNQNSAIDQMRIAFSLLNKDELYTETPERVRILLEFASTDVIDPDNFARLEVDISKTDVIFENNRYFVVTKFLQDLIKSSGFTWNTINVVKIYVSVFELDEDEEEIPSENFYVALDGLRLENVTSQNPLYGMTAYTVVRNENPSGVPEPITKEANSSNVIEFRFGMDVV